MIKRRILLEHCDFKTWISFQDCNCKWWCYWMIAIGKMEHFVRHWMSNNCVPHIIEERGTIAAFNRLYADIILYPLMTVQTKKNSQVEVFYPVIARSFPSSYTHVLILNFPRTRSHGSVFSMARVFTIFKKDVKPLRSYSSWSDLLRYFSFLYPLATLG